MEIHELSPEQEQIADTLYLAFNAMLKRGITLKEAAHDIVSIAIEAEETLAA